MLLKNACEETYPVARKMVFEINIRCFTAEDIINNISKEDLSSNSKEYLKWYLSHC